MPLIAHFPFNGNYNNYGSGFVTATNAGSTWTTGYIGQAANFDGNTEYIYLQGQALFDCFKGGSNPFSICFWLYNGDGNSSATAQRAVFFGDFNTTGAMNFNIEKNANGSPRLYWAANPDWSVPDTTIGASWSHLCFTYDGSNLRCYLNGVLKGTRAGILSTQSKTSGEYRIGRDSRSGDTAWNGAINDFRVYNHCLSQMEINQLQHPMVCHYVFNDTNIEPTTNLITSLSINNSRIEAAGNGFDIKVVAGDAYCGINLASALSTSIQYTLSFDVSGMEGNDVCAFGFYASGMHNITNIHNGHNEITFTPWSAVTSLTFDDSGRSTSHVISLRNFQLEAKSYSTPFVPFNTSRTSKIYDVTNNGYNLSLTSTNAATIGAGDGYTHKAANFNATQYYTGTAWPAACNGNCTVSLWVKWTNTSNSVVFADYSTKAGLGLYNSGKQIIVAAGRSIYVMTPANFAPTQWNHICIVYTGTSASNVICYVNGVRATGSGANNWSHNVNNFTLGARNNGSYNTNFNGSIADLRMYFGQLTETEIQTLYAHRAAIDHAGNLYCAEYECGSDTILLPDANYVVTSGTLVEGSNIANIKRDSYTINIEEIKEGL